VSTSTSDWFALRALGGETWQPVAKVRAVELRGLVDLAGEEAAAQRN
jgi:hypothetical protein